MTLAARAAAILTTPEAAQKSLATRWFVYLCEQEGIDPVACFRQRLGAYFPKGPKPPFNAEARLKAGQTPGSYDWKSTFSESA
ncbi:MAG: DUF455 family protein [Rhodospirillales bacterium]|nr:DUF455 family protein [Rhodospirillales bacterium]